jgi:hypothetical protein
MPHLVKARASQADATNSARHAKHSNHNGQQKHRHEEPTRTPRGILSKD